MHNAYGSGAMALYRRLHAKSHPSRCRRCSHVDSTGLIDGLCTKCFCRSVQPAIQIPQPRVRTSKSPEAV